MKYFKITFGNILICFAYAFICVPNEILNGGVTSFSMVAAKLIHIDVSICSSLLIIFLLVFCYFFLGVNFFKGTLYSGLCYILFFDLFSYTEMKILLPAYISVPISAVLVGIGYGLCLNAQSTTVGFDTIAIYLHKKYKKFSTGTFMFIINVIVLCMSMFVYGLFAIVLGIVFSKIQTMTIDVYMKISKGEFAYGTKSKRYLQENK